MQRYKKSCNLEKNNLSAPHLPLPTAPQSAVQGASEPENGLPATAYFAAPALPVVQYMYSICTVFVRFGSVQILYIYCTYTVQRTERVL